MGHARRVTDIDHLLSSDAGEVCMHVVPLPASIMLATASCLHGFGDTLTFLKPSQNAVALPCTEASAPYLSRTCSLTLNR